MSHTLPQSQLRNEQQAKVTRPVGVYNPGGGRIGELQVNEIVDLMDGPQNTAEGIMWRIKDNSGPGSGFTYEYRDGHFHLAPVGPPPSGEGFFWYTVGPGDNWSKIASDYGTTVAILQSMNRQLIRPQDILHPGDRMRVPGNP
jgi:hypothetical protein